MWHVCEERLAGAGERLGISWQEDLISYAQTLGSQFQAQRDLIDNWYGICKTMFPLYVDYWSKHPDVLDRTPLLQEQVFDVPYKLPSGRTVRLRGKWDSVDLIGKGKGAGIYLQENKTKQKIDEGQIKRQLTFDLQTMLYLVALQESMDRQDPDTSVGQVAEIPKKFVSGVRYNVIKRPAQYQGKKETRGEFLTRLAGIIQEDPGQFFMRWKVEISPTDIAKFRRECLDPILEQLCDWWGWINGCLKEGKQFWDNDVSMIYPWYGPEEHHSSAIHWRHPFGVYNVMNEGGISDLDEYLHSGNEVGLVRAERLFEELG